MNATDPGFASAVGVFAGVVGVSIAVYLQLMSSRSTPWPYVVGFFVGGCVLILVNPGSWLAGSFEAFADELRLVGAVVALVAELGIAIHVFQEYRVESPGELIGDLFRQDGGDA